MLILGIETTGPYCSVALCREGEIIAEETGQERLNHLSNLIPMIDRVLKSAGLVLDDVEGMALSMGPGSFTGIRIGVSTARAICQVKGIPIIPCSTLASIGLAQEGEADFVCPIMDARQNQTYSALYKEGQELVPGRAYDIADILSEVKKTVESAGLDRPSLIFVGDGIERYSEEIGDFAKSMGHMAEISWENKPQEAGHLCLLAERMLADFGVSAMTEDYDSVLPMYMRKSAPERKLEERLK